jgi:hypothetical protein
MIMPLDIIRMAIRDRRQLEFNYRGFRRVVEPMTLGIGHKGHWQIRAQQVGGRSSSGTVGTGAPKLFEVALMSPPELLSTTFEVPLTYQSNDAAFVHIDIELSGRTNAA